jgi:large subunit ribosomal protein L25
MERVEILKAELRKQAGTKQAVQIRRQGKIPAIVYGHKEEPVAISLNAHDFNVQLHHGRRLFDVTLGGKKQKLLVKDLQYDHLGKEIVHADLMRVDLSETVRVTVPIELKGTAAGTHEGGIIEEHVDHLEVECRVTEIPDILSVSVKDIGVGDALHAGQIELPEGVKLVSDPDSVVVTCHLVAAAKTTEEIEEEVPITPEVISERKEEQAEPSKDQSDRTSVK